MANDIKQQIITFLSEIPSVEHVFIASEGRVWNAVAMIGQALDHEEEAVSEREKRIQERFRGHQFCFHVLARDGRPFEEIACSKTPAWSRSDSGEQ